MGQKRSHDSLKSIVIILLQYTNPEDCSFALISVNKISLGNIQKCFILSSIIHHQMFLACNPAEAIALLKSLIPLVGIQTHSIIVLTILHGLEGYSKMHLSVIIDFCKSNMSIFLFEENLSNLPIYIYIFVNHCI